MAKNDYPYIRAWATWMAQRYGNGQASREVLESTLVLARSDHAPSTAIYWSTNMGSQERVWRTYEGINNPEAKAGVARIIAEQTNDGTK